MPKRDPAKLKKVSVSLPFGIGSAEWNSDPTERKAAWALYIELVTRIAVQPLAAHEGLLRETLSSLHSLFATTRSILREAGPDVGASRESVGGIAIAVLNEGLRPFLSKWHPLMMAWEARRDSASDRKEHKLKWDEEPKFRQELNELIEELNEYADALAVIAGVK